MPRVHAELWVKTGTYSDRHHIDRQLTLIETETIEALVRDRGIVVAPINDLDSVLRIFYLGWYIRDAQPHPDVPRLTDDQMEAMELPETTANDPSFHLEMDFQPGDVQLLNNGRILHAREAYEDDDDPPADAICSACSWPRTASPASRTGSATASQHRPDGLAPVAITVVVSDRRLRCGRVAGPGRWRHRLQALQRA